MTLPWILVALAVAIVTLIAHHAIRLSRKLDVAEGDSDQQFDGRIAAELEADRLLGELTGAVRRAVRAETLLAAEQVDNADLRQARADAERMLAFEAARWEVGQ